MAGRRATRSYTIQPFQVGSDQSEIDLLIINFLADSLAAAEAQAMIYVSNGAAAFNRLLQQNRHLADMKHVCVHGR